MLPDLIRRVRETNQFYLKKFADLPTDPALAELPFTTKAELIADQKSHTPYGSNLSDPVANYSRVHQTSGTTTGVPLRWLDTNESWQALLDCWKMIYGLAGVTSRDRLFFPFSFGPFLGFWTAFEAGHQLGAMVIPAGGLSSTARLRLMADHAATMVCCTPTYALHLAEVAHKEGVDLAATPVTKLIVAGEPGGAIPATRERIEAAWGARVLDHYGMTEVGPVAVEPLDRPGPLAVLASHYVAEVINPDTGRPSNDGELGELVLTTLKRVASPLIRYRTGDLVRRDGTMPTEFGELPLLEGGVLGRADDMIHLRGNNVYPAAIEAVIRRFDGVAEFRLIVDESGPMADLKIELEPHVQGEGGHLADRVGRALRDELLFRAEVTAVPTGSLPRFEMKAKRVVRTGRGH